jgi:hypothetical protein
MKESHVNFFRFASTFPVVAGRAGGDNVRPDVLPAQVARHHMIDRHPPIAFSAVLTGIIVAAKHLAARQFDMWTRSVHLILEPNHGRARQQLFHCPNMPTPIYDHIGLTREKQTHCPPRGTDINRFKISVEH